MKFSVIGSGSTGNSVLIQTERTRVLVDAGLSARETLRRLGEMGEDHEKLDAILITHEHSDHAGGLRVLLNTVKCPVFISDLTLDAYLSTKRADNEGLKRKAAVEDRTVSIESSTPFTIGDIDFEPFSVPHDAVDNLGFVAKKNGARVATLMDFGHITTLIKEKLRGCDAIIVESNHSIDMLRACHVYSWDLKQRIASRTGHLSNEALAEWLTEDFDGAARHIILAHLSQRANEPNLAKLTAESSLKMRSPLYANQTNITLSFHNSPTEWIEL